MAKFDWESGKRRKGNKQANRFPPLPLYLFCWDFNRKISFRWDHKSSRGLYLNLQNFWSLDLAETKKNTVIHCESARLTKSSARNLVDASAKSSWLSKTARAFFLLRFYPPCLFTQRHSWSSPVGYEMMSPLLPLLPPPPPFQPTARRPPPPKNPPAQVSHEITGRIERGENTTRG